MPVQDTSLPACHAERTATVTGLGEVRELRKKPENPRPVVVDPEVAWARTAGFSKQADILAILPQFFEIDSDDGPCPSCWSRGLVVDDDGSFAVCSCMSGSLDRWAIKWIEYVIKLLVVFTREEDLRAMARVRESAS